MLGCIAGCAIALIFYLRMQIEQRLGKAGTLQASLGGFETEDVLYLIPIATLCDRTASLLIAAGAVAPLYAAWVVFEYWRVMHRPQAATTTGLRLAVAAIQRSETAPTPQRPAEDWWRLDLPALQRNYRDQGSFVFMPDFLSGEIDREAVRVRRKNRAIG